MSSQQAAPQPFQRLARGRHQRALKIAAASALGTVVLAASGCGSHSTNPTQDSSPTRRVLQSVDVMMAGDGTTTAIKGTTVQVKDDPAKAFTTDATYNPDAVSSALPVRVRTSYHAGNRTGTNLADLKGYAGRVEIDLTVENLTVKPQTVRYDSGGQQKSRTAMVGAPMTVVASTDLDGTDAANVITAAGANGAHTTNGVLSRSYDGSGIVQWGAILAPPELGSTATMRLVTDATNFRVPTFNVTVEPGMVTDPSVAGLLNTSFNSSDQTQLALEKRTIDLIGNVNQTLASASSTIGNVRSNLSSTSKTLGTKSVSDLQDSTKQVAGHVNDVHGQLVDLKKDLAQTLDSTRSNALDQLGRTITTLDNLLGEPGSGDTGTGVTTTTDADGCVIASTHPTASETVYGNLMQVSDQLHTYAAASKGCKQRAQQTLLTTIGPAQPTAKNCTTASATCTLLSTRASFAVSMAKLAEEGQAEAAKLQPTLMTNATTQYQAMSEAIDTLTKQLATLKQQQPVSDAEVKTAIDASITNLTAAVTAIRTRFTDIHNEAAAARRQINGLDADDQDGDDQGKDGTGTANSMLHQVSTLADEICTLEPETTAAVASSTPAKDSTATTDPTDPTATAPTASTAGSSTTSSAGTEQPATATPTATASGVTSDQLTHLRGYLTDTDCSGAKLPTPASFPAPLDARLKLQADSWSDVMALTSSQADADPAHLLPALASIDDTIKKLQSESGALGADAGGKDNGASTLDDINATVATLAAARDKMAPAMDALKSQQDALATDITSAFSKAADDATTQVGESIDNGIREVGQQGAADSDALGRMFDQSAQGMDAAASSITANGSHVIAQQRTGLRKVAADETADINSEVKHSLGSISTSVTSSTHDLDGADALLQADFTRVLRDLGTNSAHSTGLLGTLATSTAMVGGADYQLAQAARTTTQYSNVRNTDVDAILLRQAELKASLDQEASLPPFQISLPQGTQHETVYTFHLGGN